VSENFLTSIPKKARHILTKICLRRTAESVLSYNSKRNINAEGLLKITVSRPRCKSGNISETVRDGYIGTLIVNHM